MPQLDFHLKNTGPKVTLQPDTYEKIQIGIHQILEAVRPTLGPLPRNVAVDKYTINSQPELLDDGALIARRVIQLPDRDVNTGAMMIRGMLYKINERVGDGTATAAVLYSAVFDGCLKYIQAGGNPMLLSKGLHQATGVVLDHLDTLVRPVGGKQSLVGIARTVCHDDQLAAELGEIFYTIGEFGLLETNIGRSRENYYEYVLGHYWPTNGAIVGGNNEAAALRKEVENAGVFVSDLEFKTPEELVPVLRAALQAELNTLVIIAQSMDESVIRLIHQSQRSAKLRILAVKGPYLDSERMANGLEDIGVLTGGQVYHRAAGMTAAKVTPQDLGFARRFWIDKNVFSLSGGGGDPRKIRQYVADLRERFYRSEKPEGRKRLKDRLGRMLGGAANFEVGGLTKPEMDTKREIVKRSEATLRSAVKGGLLPGGGTALLACRAALQEAASTLTDENEIIAYKILGNALRAPLMALMENSGLDGTKIFGQIEAVNQAGYGYDILRGEYGLMFDLGVVDVAEVIKDAARTAIKSAALALTVDVIIHKKDPIVMANPE